MTTGTVPTPPTGDPRPPTAETRPPTAETRPPTADTRLATGVPFGLTGPGQRRPGPPGPALLAAVGAVGVLAGLGVAFTPAGASWTVTGLAMLAIGAVVVHRRRVAHRGGTVVDRTARRVLAGLAALLLVVPSLTTSPWLVALCLLGAFGLGAATVTDARTWRSMLLALPALPLDAVLAVVWTASGVRGVRLPGHGASWLRTAAVTLASVWVVVALLASGDAAFGAVVRHVVPRVDVGTVPARIVVAGLAIAMLLTLLRAGLRANRTPDEPHPVRRRPVQEWAIPLAALDGVLVVFFALQAYLLFGGPEVVATAGVTYAERARQGFGQLAAVTAVTLALIAWAAARCDASSRRDRLVRDVLAGALVGLSLLVVASALHRMWLYEEAYGYTVSRYVVVVVELLIGALFLLLAAARWPAVARLLPRLVAGALAVAVLVLGFSRPDAVVATLNLDRYERTGALDVRYLSFLSDDAVPAIRRLPAALERCVLDGRAVGERPWYAVNLGHARAAATLATGDAVRYGASCASPSGAPPTG